MLSYVEAEREYYKGKRVIELGAGTGIVGIGAAICGSKSAQPASLERGLLNN
jgi:predicted nicotinamide N-methyase